MADVVQTYGAVATLNGRTYGFTGTKTITGVTKIFEDTVTVADGTDSTLLTFSATAAGASLASVKLIMLVNNETSGNPAVITVTDTGADEYSIQIPAGHAHFISTEKLEISASGAGFSAFSTMDTIKAQGDGATASISIAAFGT